MKKACIKPVVILSIAFQGVFTFFIYKIHGGEKDLETFQFWLSETPDVPGSIHPTASLPRICTYSKFSSKENEKFMFYFFNTHYSHVSSNAREVSSNIIVKRLINIVEEDDIPIFLVGDLNCKETSKAFKIFINNGFTDTLGVYPGEKVKTSQYELQSAGFIVKQNYPNPFNKNTMIQYDLPLAEFVEIRIFDISGKEITKLLSVYQLPGSHTIEWDRQDARGKNLTTGFYFYDFRTATYQKRKKMSFIE